MLQQGMNARHEILALLTVIVWESSLERESREGKRGGGVGDGENENWGSTRLLNWWRSERGGMTGKLSFSFLFCGIF